jgi:hypothetical protein
VWDKESSWRAKEQSPEQAQIRKLLDGLCEGAALDLSSLAAFKNQFHLDKDFTPAADEGVMRMALFLVPRGTDEATFARNITDLQKITDFAAGWGQKESQFYDQDWKAFLVLSKWKSVAQSESVMAEVEPSLSVILEPFKAKTLVVRRPFLHIPKLSPVRRTLILPFVAAYQVEEPVGSGRAGCVGRDKSIWLSL